MPEPPAQRTPLSSPAVAGERPSSPPEDERTSSPSKKVGGVVIKNALFLTLGRVAGMPLSILASAVSARYLGPAALGFMYLGFTMNSMGNLAVDWGQSGALPQRVAQDRARAGVLLGTSLVWRVAMSVATLGAMILASRALGYDRDFLPVLCLIALAYFFSSIGGAAQQVIIGYERTDVSAYSQIIEQLAGLAFTVPVLMLGGKVNEYLLASAAAGFVGMAYGWRSLRLVGDVRMSFRVDVLKALLVSSTPFAFTSVVVVLQPYLDALFLSKFAVPEVIGWHAAARKLVGVLIFPATAMVGALYPTLCRLYGTDRDTFLSTANGALRGTSLMVFPVALGCFLYPGIGISIFSEAGFAPAEDNLRVMSLFIFLVYFTMPLGVAILAAGKQRAWALVQSLCVLVSLVADPLLIPIAQRHFGNGGLGVCVAAVLSEVLVVGCTVWMTPEGTFDRRFWRAALSAMVGGAAMALAAYSLRSLNQFVAAFLALAAYLGGVWASGGLEPDFVRAVRNIFGSKLARTRG